MTESVACRDDERGRHRHRVLGSFDWWSKCVIPTRLSRVRSGLGMFMEALTLLTLRDLCHK